MVMGATGATGLSAVAPAGAEVEAASPGEADATGAGDTDAAGVRIHHAIVAAHPMTSAAASGSRQNGVGDPRWRTRARTADSTAGSGASSFIDSRSVTSRAQASHDAM